MKILMVTPHLPPHQAANALLPHLLGTALKERGHHVSFLTFGDAPSANDIAYVKRRRGILRPTRLPQLLEAAETWWKARPLVRQADVVHVHSNTWMNQVAAGIAVRSGRPYLLTHYGTEIWHHDGKDPVFHRLNRRAHHVTFYSKALLARGAELGVPWREASVVYPPVSDVFRAVPPDLREEVRGRYLPDGGVLLLNVKRLHPLADHETLLTAFAAVHRERPDTRLLIAGSGETEATLRQQTHQLGLAQAVHFLGLVPNDEVALLQGSADLFVLSSVLEATPTVALEALAAGTPVVSTDNPGGIELHALFGDDVAVVPKQAPAALAEGVLVAIRTPRRVTAATTQIIGDRFRLAGVVERYLALYEAAAA